MDKQEVARILNGRMSRPTHPGELLRENVMPAAGLTQLQLAKALAVSRKTISEIVLGQRPVTVDMAVSGKLFRKRTKSVAEHAKAVDLWDAINMNRQANAHIKPLKVQAA